MILGFRPGPLGEGAAAAAASGADFVYLPAARPDAAVGADALSVAACLMSLTPDIGLAAEISTAWPSDLSSSTQTSCREALSERGSGWAKTIRTFMDTSCLKGRCQRKADVNIRL